MLAYLSSPAPFSARSSQSPCCSPSHHVSIHAHGAQSLACHPPTPGHLLFSLPPVYCQHSAAPATQPGQCPTHRLPHFPRPSCLPPPPPPPPPPPASPPAAQPPTSTAPHPGHPMGQLRFRESAPSPALPAPTARLPSLELAFPPLAAWENHRIQGPGFKVCASLVLLARVCSPRSLGEGRWNLELEPLFF